MAMRVVGIKEGNGDGGRSNGNDEDADDDKDDGNDNNGRNGWDSEPADHNVVSSAALSTCTCQPQQ